MCVSALYVYTVHIVTERSTSMLGFSFTCQISKLNVMLKDREQSANSTGVFQLASNFYKLEKINTKKDKMEHISSNLSFDLEPTTFVQVVQLSRESNTSICKPFPSSWYFPPGTENSYCETS